MFSTRNETWLQWKTGWLAWVGYCVIIHQSQATRKQVFNTEEHTVIILPIPLQATGHFQTVIKALIPTEITRNTVCYRTGGQERCCHAVSAQDKKARGVEEHRGRQQKTALCASKGRHKLPPILSNLREGEFLLASSLVTCSTQHVWTGQQLRVLSAAVWPACVWLRLLHERGNREKILKLSCTRRQRQVGSSSTEAAKCAVVLFQWSVWCKVAFCLQVCFPAVLHCVHALMLHHHHFVPPVSSSSDVFHRMNSFQK